MQQVLINLLLSPVYLGAHHFSVYCCQVLIQPDGTGHFVVTQDTNIPTDKTQSPMNLEQHQLANIAHSTT